MEGEKYLENNVVGQKHDGLKTLTECFHILNLSFSVKFFYSFILTPFFFFFLLVLKYYTKKPAKLKT